MTTGASNLEELNLLMKEVSIRRRKEEVLELPPKIRSWVPVDISGSKAAFNAVERFLTWYAGTDPSQPNDTEFLARLDESERRCTRRSRGPSGNEFVSLPVAKRRCLHSVSVMALIATKEAG